MGEFFLINNNKVCKCEYKNLAQNSLNLTLAKLSLNQTAKILNYKAGIAFSQKKRLLELGFIKENTVKLVGKSMLGKVLLFEINGFMLSISARLANHIVCEKVYG